MMLSGEEVKADSGQEVALLSRHQSFSAGLPDQSQLRKGENKGRQKSCLKAFPSWREIQISRGPPLGPSKRSRRSPPEIEELPQGQGVGQRLAKEWVDA